LQISREIHWVLEAPLLMILGSGCGGGTSTHTTASTTKLIHPDDLNENGDHHGDERIRAKASTLARA
jgi:hypothetical protein